MSCYRSNKYWILLLDRNKLLSLFFLFFCINYSSVFSETIVNSHSDFKKSKYQLYIGAGNYFYTRLYENIELGNDKMWNSLQFGMFIYNPTFDRIWTADFRVGFHGMLFLLTSLSRGWNKKLATFTDVNFSAGVLVGTAGTWDAGFFESGLLGSATIIQRLWYTPFGVYATGSMRYESVFIYQVSGFMDYFITSFEMGALLYF